MKIYGYARVSTRKQNIERQIRNIDEYVRSLPEAQNGTVGAVCVTDEYTGTKLDRPGWSKLYNVVQPGDMIIFDEVSRMSRNADEGFAIYEELYQKGVELVFLKEHHIDTATYKAATEKQIHAAVDSGNAATDNLINSIFEALNRYTLELVRQQIRLAFERSEEEVQFLRKRTREGIETARMNGEQIGQKAGTKLTTKKSIAAKLKILKHSQDFGGSLNDSDCITLTGLSRNTFYKYKRELKEDNSFNPLAKPLKRA